MNGLSIQKQKANDKMMDAVLEYAGACHVENIANEMDALGQMPNGIPYPTELDIKMRKLIAGYNRRIRRKKFWKTSQKILTKVAVFVFIIVLGISILAVGVKAFRIKLLNFIIEVRGEYTRVEIADSDVLPNDPHINIQDWEGAYLPTYIPKGYSVAKAKGIDEMKFIHYSNSIGDLVIFNQYSDINTDLRIDTKNAKTDIIIIQGEEGLLIDKADLTVIIWHNDEFTFMIMGKIDNNELIKMAKSIEKSK